MNIINTKDIIDLFKNETAILFYFHSDINSIYSNEIQSCIYNTFLKLNVNKLFIGKIINSHLNKISVFNDIISLNIPFIFEMYDTNNYFKLTYTFHVNSNNEYYIVNDFDVFSQDDFDAISRFKIMDCI